MGTLLTHWSDAPVVAIKPSKIADEQPKLVYRIEPCSERINNMSKAKTKTENKTEKALAAEKEQFNKQQVSVFLFCFFFF